MFRFGAVSIVFLAAIAGFAATQRFSPTVAGAQEFMQEVEARLLPLVLDNEHAQWVKSTYITVDTEALAARFDERAIGQTVLYSKESTEFDGLTLPPELARKLKLLRLSLSVATPAEPAKAERLTEILARMEGAYGSAKYCSIPEKCLDLEDLSRILRTSTDPKLLLDAWKGWHDTGRALKPLYQKYVMLANEGARDLGFADNGAMWRSKYDMTPEAFEREEDRLWEQVRPLYLSLHAYVRWKLREKYGDLVPAHGPIPAHLLGNMWAQEWENVFSLVAPADSGPGINLTGQLRSRNTQPLDMVRYGERFFTSLGFPPLPETFWQRSQFVKPRDREVVCHASAWDLNMNDDLRLKMCIEVTGEDFTTIHHELGHNFYQRAYSKQPLLFRESANDGFHEAIGDTIALSVTPGYLVKVGLLKDQPQSSSDIPQLLGKALEKVAFLPFGLLVDKWRWDVFAGKIKPEQYNAAWWALRLKYQGVTPPVERNAEDFDAGAKYHVPANFPYSRYFVADILQFQFHRALSRIAGCTGPLNRCSIYGNKEAGERLNAMLSMGASKPWPDALETLTGEREMDASAILDYFAPLKKWLDQQNQGKPVGW